MDDEHTDPPEDELLTPPTTDTQVISIDDLQSPAAAVLIELLLTTEPVTAPAVAEQTETDPEAVTDVAATLTQQSVLFTDSRTPALTPEAQFYPNPLVEWALTATRIVRHTEDVDDVTAAIDRHDERIDALRDQTGFDDAYAYNEAVFDETTDVEQTPEREEQALQWILTTQQRDQLEQIRDRYDWLDEQFAMFDELDGFTPTPVTPPKTERQRYLYPPELPLF